MSTNIDDTSLHALKIAFSYMPKRMDVTQYEYGERYQTVLAHIDAVREALLIQGVDPDEVFGEIHPERSPNSSY